ncbi:MAG: flagellar motor switch protein FliM [Geminicoccaceae bacterium]|nr:flagellar motor switch protein FliM [Geminicoccaceae bacterium]
MAPGNDEEGDAVDQDAMAAEWAAMAGADGEEGGEGEAGAGGEDELASSWASVLQSDDLGSANTETSADEASSTGRELNQNEIDSLLGFSDDSAPKERSGILAIINSNDISYERLPMLEVVFDRLERMLTTSVRNFTSENVDINLENITAQRFGDYLNSVPLPALISVFKAVEWDNFGLITVDSPMIYSIVDVLLGGRRGTIPMRVEGRPYTTIEASLVERLIRLILADLSSAFAPITPVQFRFDRMETNPRFAAIARPGNACVVFKLRIDVQDRGGSVEFLIPYATLEPARDLLLQMFMGEKFGRDSIWENHLAREILVTDVDLEAVLDEQLVTLHDVTRWEVGTILPLNARDNSQVTVRCGNVPMLKGRVGKIGDHMAIEIEETLQRLGPQQRD